MADAREAMHEKIGSERVCVYGWRREGVMGCVTGGEGGREGGGSARVCEPFVCARAHVRLPWYPRVEQRADITIGMGGECPPNKFT